jgi:tRNA C32,U32 (ribose-2'-O)-methylase TrmJ
MEDLRFCHHWCSLGAFGYYPSLNISHAVLLGLYNLRRFLELRDLEKEAASLKETDSNPPVEDHEPRYEIEEIESWRKQWDQPSEQDESKSKEEPLTETSQSIDSEAPSALSSSTETEVSAENTEANTQDGAKLQPFYYPEDTLREWLETMGLNTREKKVNALTVLNRMILESDPTQRELKILETLLQQNMRMLRQSGAVRRQRGLGNSDHDL